MIFFSLSLYLPLETSGAVTIANTYVPREHASSLTDVFTQVAIAVQDQPFLLIKSLIEDLAFCYCALIGIHASKRIS